MKPLFVLFCALLLAALPTLTYAQYRSIFGQSSTYWIGDLNTYPTPHKDSTWYEKDTLINNETYKVVRRAAIPNDIIFKNSTLYVKEDTTLGKVWYCNPIDTNKRVLFDYALNPHDGFRMVYFDGIGINYGGELTIYYRNQRKYIEIPLPIQFGCQLLTFIEGVGSMQGLFYMNDPLPNYPNDINACQIICQHKDGVLSYESSDSGQYENCTFGKNYIGTAEFASGKEEITIYPNPNSGIFKLTFTNIGSRQISVYDVLGHLVSSLTSTDNTVTINLPDNAKGVYFVTVQSESGLFRTKVSVNP